MSSIGRAKGPFSQDWVPSPQFAACDLPGPCGPPDLRTHYLLDLLLGLVGPAQAAADRGASPALLQIGSADFSSSSRFSGIHLWTGVLELLPDPLRERVSLVFVDPNSEHEAEVRQGLRRLPIRASQARFVNAMVTDTCASEHITMYNFSQQAPRDFGVPGGVLRSWLGPTRTYPLEVLAGYSGTAGMETPLRDNWLAFNRAANSSQYVQEVRVPCLTPGSLLRKVGIWPWDFVMAVVDAKQADVPIVGAMLDLPGFRPWFLQFELTIWDASNFREMEEFNATAALLRRLRFRGFEVGKTYGNGRGGSDADNCIVVPPENFPPQFSGCDRPRPCGPEGSRWNYLQDLLQINVLPKMQEVAGRGELPVVLQIGSCDLSSPHIFTDMDLYNRMLAMIPPALQQSLRFVFVDAQSDWEWRLWQRLGRRQLPIELSQALFVQGYITGKCTSEFTSMYRYGHQAVADFGVPEDTLRAWFASSRDGMMNTLFVWVRNVVPGLPAAEAAAWRAFSQAENYSAYVTRVQVPCLTIGSLLEKADISVGRMAMVIIDAEGQDANIISSLLDWPHWRPGYLQYESSVWAHRKNLEIVRRLHSRGYAVGMTYGGNSNGSDMNNVIAVLSQFAAAA